MRYASFPLVLLLCFGCHHDHSHGPGGHHHGAKAHSHQSSAAGGHTHGGTRAPDHDHDDPTIALTLWSERYELFGEHPPGVVGDEMSILLHLTQLEDFQPLEKATVSLEFGEMRASTSTALRPGIFRLVLTPEKAGRFSGTLTIKDEGGEEARFEGLEFRVFEDKTAAKKSVAEEGDEGAIAFLKEQQWGVPFNTGVVSQGSLVAAVQVAGRIDTPPGGVAEVGAPVPGRLVAPEGGLPRPGTSLEKGQVVASLMPAPSSPEAAARASLAVAEAGARASAARSAVDRAGRLIKDEAISQRELEDARRELRIAKESVRAAKRAASLYSAKGGVQSQQMWQLEAPIDGTLVSVQATVGASVAPGEPLFRIVNTNELWIVARVPEQDAARLRSDKNPSFQVAGLDSWKAIRLAGDAPTGSLVTVSRLVDPVSRTVDVIYSTHATDESMRVGGLVQVSLPAGDEFKGVVIPKSALMDQEGRQVVYVQIDGEHFEERLVRVGPRAGNQVAIEKGLRVGERIVIRGAHLIKLADRSGGAPAHGHLH